MPQPHTRDHTAATPPRADAPLRIGIDGEALRTPLSGVGQYVYHLGCELEALLPQAQFYVYTRIGAQRLALPSARWHVRREAVPAWRRLPSFLWLKTRGRALCRADRLDVFWAGRTLHPGLGAPVRTVVTVHDLNHLLVPRTMQAATRWSHRLWFAHDLKHADCVLANSEGTLRRLGALLPERALRGVVAPGLAPELASGRDDAAGREALSRLDIEPPYVLSVGTLEPRKNVDVLLAAFLAMKQAGELPRHRLVVAGASGWNNEPLARALRASHDAGVRVPGYVPDEWMPALYAGADMLVCASRYEGFGMPVLEARACGTPVVVADTPELREAGGRDAIVVEATVGGVCGGIRSALAAPRPHDPGLAQRHSWRHAAERLAAALRSAAEPA